MADRRRQLALDILIQGERNSTHPIDSILANSLREGKLSQHDRAWITEVVLGVTRQRGRLDFEIETAFHGRYAKAQHALRAALRLGLYQLRQMDTPSHAAVNATVEVAKKKLPKGAVRLLNGVLRNLQRKPVDFQNLPGTLSEEERLAIRESHPLWLVQRWRTQFGLEILPRLLHTNNVVPKAFVRINGQTGSMDDFRQACESAGISISQTLSESPHVLEVFNLPDLLSSELYGAGKFWVQDLAAAIVPELLPLGNGDIVLDLCAAPGGKTAVLADRGTGRIELHAADVNPTRLKRLRRNLQRLEFTEVQLHQWDAAEDDLPAADAILLDVPCSGTGVLHRRADSRWRKSADDIRTLATLQTRILDNAWRALKSGGHLVYATCSLEREENQDQVRTALDRHPDMVIVPVENPALRDYVDKNGFFVTHPWEHDMDGMFAAVLRKN